MACQCGSQKKSTAPDTINPVNIGNLCFLFGVEGALCGFLDLIPTTINSILKVNKKPEDADEIFWKWVAKFAKTGYSVVIDEATGGIDLTSFCGNPPPPLPEDITFDDVFRFFVEAVPIVSKWLFVADIVLGIETKLIDKVTAYWLFKQWYENCECTKCPPPVVTSQFPDSPIDLECTYPEPRRRCRNLIIHANPEYSTRAYYARGAMSSCHGFFMWGMVSRKYRENGELSTEIIEKWWVNSDNLADLYQFRLEGGMQSDRDYAIRYGIRFYYYKRDTNPHIAIEPWENQSEYYSQKINNVLIEREKTEDEQWYRETYDMFYVKDGVSVPWGGDNAVIPYEKCPEPPPPPPPTSFCDLYPDHPDCNQNDQDDPISCETEKILVAQFTKCNFLRSPKLVQMIIDGDLAMAEVSEFSQCNQPRITKQIEYLECPSTEPPPSECDSVDCSETYSNTKSALYSILQPGITISSEADALDLLIQGGGYFLNFECCVEEINNGISDFMYEIQIQ